MLVSIDLGYGYTKGVNEEGKKVIFPSVVGPGRDRSIASLFDDNMRGMDSLHVVVDGMEYFVGELAEKESSIASRTLSSEKITHPNTKVLLATATALLMPEGIRNVQLVTGLPYADYKKQSKQFEDFLRFFNTDIEFISGPLAGRKKKITFSKDVFLFPQAAGALFALLDDRERKEFLNSKKMISVVDIGYKTTDVVTFEWRDGPQLRTELSDTFDIGMSNVTKLVDLAFREKTGDRLSKNRIEQIIRDKVVYYNGQELDMTKEIALAHQHVAKTIADEVMVLWKEEKNSIFSVYLAGGGAIALHSFLKNLHPRVKVAPDAQFANAEGFLKFAYLLKTFVDQKDNVEAQE